MASTGVSSAIRISRHLTRIVNPATFCSQPPIRDFVSPTNSHLLSVMLGAFLPSAKPKAGLNKPRETGVLPYGHHFVYYPAPAPEHFLLPDGSDANQNPNPTKYPRRMWASGTIEFKSGIPFNAPSTLTELIENNDERNGNQYVQFQRRITDDKSKVLLIERRTLVFLPERAEGEVPVLKHIPVTDTPTFEYTFKPSQNMLTRFSALTYNAHRIHYDRPYTKDVEKYPDLLCHGPFAVIVLLETVRDKLFGQRKAIVDIDYRCIAPMFVDQPYKVAGFQDGDDKWKLWVETPQGGIAVRAVITTETKENPKPTFRLISFNKNAQDTVAEEQEQSKEQSGFKEEKSDVKEES